MEFKEYKAKTVNDAITDALIELEITSDMLEYEVIEEGSSRLLGLFSKDAVIRARKKEIVEEVVEKIDIRPDFKAELRSIKENKPEEKKAPKAEPKKEKKAEVKQPVKKEVREEVKEDKKEEKREEKQPESKKEPVKKESVIITGEAAENKEVNEVLYKIFAELGIKAAIHTSIDETEKVISIDIDGDDTGDLIGKRGQTLDAVQYLCSIIINKKQADYYRVKVDTNNYRERRQKTLENLAKNLASKVKKTKKKVALEPMNPYERRVIHSYLQSDKYVTTKSEGEEPNRRVVIYYKKSGDNK